MSRPPLVGREARGRRRRGHGRSRPAVALLAGGALVLGLLRGGPGQAAAPERLYLPLLDRPALEGPPEACTLVDASWPCDGSGWTLSCGGLGSIRELIALQDEAATVLAVGDGVARFRLTGADSRPSWTAQAGETLTGLSSASLLPAADRAGVSAWAAGSAGRLALERGGCWEAAPSRNPDLVFQAIRALPPGILPGYFGWAVGARCPAGQACQGAILQLDHPRDPLAWVDWGATDLPPLEDVALRRSLAGPGGVPLETWMVGGPAQAAAQAPAAAPLAEPSCRGGDWGAGLFLRSHPDDGSRLLPLACYGQGRPQELTLTSQGGLALGRAAAGEDLLAWLVEPRSGEINLLPEPLAPGRSLADLYYANLDRSRSGQGDLPRLWMGLHPGGGGASVLWELGLSPGQAPRQEPLGLPAALRDLPPSPTAAARDAAVAPLLRDVGEAAEQLSLEGLLYAWGDGVWLREQDSGAWRQVRRRLALRSLASAPGRRSLILAEEGGASLLLGQDAAGLRQIHAYDALLAGAPRSSALLAHDQAPWPYWLAGAGGRLWGLDGQGQAGRFRPPPAPAGPGGADLVALARAEAGELWILAQPEASAPEGPEQAPGSEVWRADPAGDRWARLEGGPPADPSAGPLAELAAGPEGELWALGPGGALWSQPGCAAPAPAGRWRCGCGQLAAQPRLVCRLERSDLSSLAPAGPALAWASNGRSLLLLSPQDPRGRPWRFAAGGLPLQAGEEVRRLLVEPAGDLWLLSRCGRDAWLGEGAGRGVACSDQAPFWGRASQYRPGALDPAAGRWNPAAELRVNVEPLALGLAPAPSGRGSLWLAGDWSTLAQRPLAEGP